MIQAINTMRISCQTLISYAWYYITQQMVVIPFESLCEFIKEVCKPGIHVCEIRIQCFGLRNCMNDNRDLIKFYIWLINEHEY